MKISISTWNMAYWNHRNMLPKIWSFYTKDIADILMFQEALPDLSILRTNSLVWNAVGDTRPWGSGIYSSKYPIREVSFRNSFFGAVTAAEVEVHPEFKLIAISLYGLLEKISNEFYSIPNLHRILSDITDLLESSHTRDRIILGGDFNASRQFDDKQRVKSHQVLFNRIKEFGLYNCFEGYYTEYVQTLRHHRSKIPWQNDYMFVSNAIVSKLKLCAVLDDESIRGFSDHNPVKIELEI